MASGTQDSFELLVSVRYDPVLLKPSIENTRIFSSVYDQAYPPAVPEPTTDSALRHTAIYLPHLHQKRLIDAARFFGWQEALQHLLDGGPLASPANFNVWVNERIRNDMSSEMTLEESLPPQKLRILLSSAGILSLEAAPVPCAASIETFFPPNLFNPVYMCDKRLKNRSPFWPGEPSWSVVLDKSPIPSNHNFVDPHLHFKTTYRAVYNTARARISPVRKNEGVQGGKKLLLDEILLFNEDGYITEGSLTSVYFWRDDSWVTPRSLGAFVGVQNLNNATAGAQAGTTRLYALARGLAVEGDVHKNSIRDGEAIWLSNGVRGFGWGLIHDAAI